MPTYRFGIGTTEFLWNSNPTIQKAVEAHATYPITEKEMTEQTINKFWLRNAHGHPVTLVAYQILGGLVIYATATQHPNDPREDVTVEQRRRIPHLIAEGRLRKFEKKGSKVHTVFHRHEDPIIDIAFDMLARARAVNRSGTRWIEVAGLYLYKHDNPDAPAKLLTHEPSPEEMSQYNVDAVKRAMGL